MRASPSLLRAAAESVRSQGATVDKHTVQRLQVTQACTLRGGAARHAGCSLTARAVPAGLF